jgi:hypothetical protein
MLLVVAAVVLNQCSPELDVKVSVVMLNTFEVGLAAHTRVQVRGKHRRLAQILGSLHIFALGSVTICTLQVKLRLGVTFQYDCVEI